MIQRLTVGCCHEIYLTDDMNKELEKMKVTEKRAVKMFNMHIEFLRKNGALQTRSKFRQISNTDCDNLWELRDTVCGYRYFMIYRPRCKPVVVFDRTEKKVNNFKDNETYVDRCSKAIRVLCQIVNGGSQYNEFKKLV